MEQVGKLIALMGALLLVVGLFMMFFEKLPFGLGKLPGDIVIKRDNFTFYFPLATSILLSLILTLILNLLFRK
ncbi:DUF2905 domain-containing protein [Hydrogenobacter thermophilus]|uniref:DUF2905 domain-containing protein n=1 Tax=Hydrogenobacter thermophilus TaxID=940 RepID=UPI0030FB2082